MSGAPVAIAISEESGRRVELHDDRVKRAFRAFDGYDVKEIVPDGGTDGTGSGADWCECGHIWHNHFDGCRLCGCTEFVDESSDEATQIVPDGGHRHDTDRVDGFFIAECPNASDPDDDHLQIEVNYERATNADELIAEIRETWPDCGECGSTLQRLGANEPSEIITDGGANTYLVDDEQWYALGLIESALGRREEGRWEACRRLTQHAIAKLDRGTRAHRVIRDGCCAESHPREDQWRDALERAKTALEVRDT